MKRPSSLTFGATTWRVKWSPNLGDLAGQTEKTKDRIAVGTNQSAKRQKSTLVHEGLHAALEGSAIRAMPGYTEELEEAFVSALEGPVMELLLRPENAAAVEWVRS